MTQLDILKNAFPPCDKSLHTSGNLTVYITCEGDNNALVILGENEFVGQERLIEGVKCTLAPLSHQNAVILRTLFPFTAPKKILHLDRTVGVGDRLGLATRGHIKLFEHYDALPVLAQQSIRELNLTGRTYEEVLDCATFEVFRQDFTKGFGADGDHLKTPEQIEYALSCGFTMITLDCSDHIRKPETLSNTQKEEADTLCRQLEKEYCDKPVVLGGQSFCIDKRQLNQAVCEYSQAIDFMCEIYQKYVKGHDVDFEISIDETSVPTTPAEHYFIASQLTQRGVRFDTLAPRFCGEFQKGIDYIGNIAQFQSELKIHQAIAQHFDYKLSVHSGSDKFSIFSSVGEITQGRYHVKTAGTNWLEAVKLVAQKDPTLYRSLHKFALSVFEQARAYYHVTTNISAIPCVDQLSDDQLPLLFANNDARQLLHITYGIILQEKDQQGNYVFKDKLYKLWNTYHDQYDQLLIQHIGKHLDLLGCPKI